MSIQRAARVQRIRPSATVGITSKALQLAAEGRDIIRLSVGEPDFDTPAHVKQAAIAAIEAGHTKYTSLAGTRELREAIREKLSRENGLDYDIEQILVSNGAKQSCFNLCLSVLEEGDEAIVPAPYWVSYPEMVRLSDAEPALVHCAEDNGFLMSPEQLAAAITSSTRLLILNSPNNPTGAVYSAEAFRKLAEVLREYPRIVILSDEIYEHIQWSSAPGPSFAAIAPDLFERTVTINGMSKGYAMSGWRIGYAAGPTEIIRAMAAIQSQSTTNACSISQVAATAALTADQNETRKMRAEFERRYRAVQPLVDALPGFACPETGGAFYLFPRIEGAIERMGVADDVAFCEGLLEATGVALVPGTAFGAPGYVRISFAASVDTLREAVARIERFVTT